MPSSPNNKRKNNSKKHLKTQKGGAYATDPTPSGQLASTMRSFRLVKPNQPYVLEGAPQFPPNFMTDNSCTIL